MTNGGGQAVAAAAMSVRVRRRLGPDKTSVLIGFLIDDR